MKKEIWQNEQPVLTEDLAYSQDSKEDAMLERTKEFYAAGILRDSLNEFDFSLSVGLTGCVTIDTGIAYDVNGERIILDDASIQYPNVPVLPLTGSDGPSTYAPDGLGLTAATPQSTGSYGIPIDETKIYYLFIKYQENIDPTEYRIRKNSTEKLFVKATDGYVIVISKQDNPVSDPSTLVDATHVYLGSVDNRLGEILTEDNFDYTNRVFLSAKTALISSSTVKSDKSDRTSFYVSDSTASISDHIKAVGSAAISPTNPHGLSISDLGSTGKSTELHERLFHSNGMIGLETSLTSSLYGVVNGGYPAVDEFTIKKLTSTEYVLVKDKTIDSVVIPEDSIISFKNGTILVDNGTYTIYLDSLDNKLKMCTASPNGKSYTIRRGTTSVVQALADNSVLSITTNFPLWRVTFTYDIATYPSTYGKPPSTISEIQGIPNNGNSNFTLKVDLRIFGNIGSNQLAHDSETDTVTISHNVSIDQDLYVRGVSITGIIPELIPTGAVIPFAGTAIDNGGVVVVGGYLLCNGAQASRTTYSTLFAALGNGLIHGVGNGTTTFNLPDYRGRFLRGVDGLAGRDPDSATRTAPNINGAVGNAVGSVQEDLIKNHEHSRGSNYSQTAEQSPDTPSGFPLMLTSNTGNPTVGAGSETRPKNAYVNYLIKI